MSVTATAIKPTPLNRTANRKIASVVSFRWSGSAGLGRRNYRLHATTERGGANGLNVNGKPPTSPAAWTAMQEFLKEAGVQCMSPQELVPAQGRGMTVVDIRPSSDYDKYHIPDSVNVPFYRPIDGWSGKQVARRLAYAFFGVFNGTEYNPNFIEEVKEAIDIDKGAILVCNQGGEIKDGGYLTGASKSQTRSLMAAYYLADAGLNNLATLRGGFAEWVENGRLVCSNVYDLSIDE